MSMPEFPKDNISRENSINQILSSIAMEELALSHIINAEGEKLQYVLGTLREHACPLEPKALSELLELNASVRDTLEIVMHSQMLLNSKLRSALESREDECPKPPPPVIHCPTEGQHVYDTRPVVTGTANKGADILICVGAVCTMTSADSRGKWSVRMPVPLPAGERTLTAVQTNECCRNSAPAKVTFLIKSWC